MKFAIAIATPALVETSGLHCISVGVQTEFRFSAAVRTG